MRAVVGNLSMARRCGRLHRVRRPEVRPSVPGCPRSHVVLPVWQELAGAGSTEPGCWGSVVLPVWQELAGAGRTEPGCWGSVVLPVWQELAGAGRFPLGKLLLPLEGHENTQSTTQSRRSS